MSSNATSKFKVEDLTKSIENLASALSIPANSSKELFELRIAELNLRERSHAELLSIERALKMALVDISARISSYVTQAQQNNVGANQQLAGLDREKNALLHSLSTTTTNDIDNCCQNKDFDEYKCLHDEYLRNKSKFKDIAAKVGARQKQIELLSSELSKFQDFEPTNEALRKIIIELESSRKSLDFTFTES